MTSARMAYQHRKSAALGGGAHQTRINGIA
jgi:hypothetical protein